MTVRVTTLKGADARAYYVEALPNYYLQSGEPLGQWHGRGAEPLGLSGPVNDADFLALMAGEHPDQPGISLGRRYGDSSVRGFDVTCSAPNSVSILFAVGDDQTRTAVLKGHDKAVSAAVEWIERNALTRYRIDGEVAIVNAQGIAAATFRQHTSRSLDPQLHTHVVVANRVLSADGRWLALDARGLKLDQRTASAIYHASLQAELTRRIGVEWVATDHSIAEIGEIPAEAITAFSQRTDSIRRRVDTKIDRFIDSMHREPTPRERWRLEREAVIDSRPPKGGNIHANDLHSEWSERLEALGINIDQLQQDCLHRKTALDLHADMVDAVITDAVAALESTQSTWRPAELMREIGRQLPTNVGHTPTELLDLLETLTDEGISRCCVDISRPIQAGALLRADGRPVSESVADRALTTHAILDQEQDVLGWAQRRSSYPGIDNAEVRTEAEDHLTAAQAEVAAAVAGTGDLVLVVGPAGTGKTTALHPAIRTLGVDQRHAFGVAPSAAAAQVLEVETGLTSDTLDKLLVEHDGRRPPGRVYDLPAGTTVIVDEAGMVATDKLAALAELSDRQGWRIALIGDPLQFSAVGRGGMFAHLLDAHGAIELDEVHRFANEWERAASLRLRSGDQSIAEVFDQHGRIHGGTATRMEAEALDAWAAARRNGESVLLSAPSNDTVHRFNVAAQQQRIHLGEINPRSRSVEAGGYEIHMGDEIVTRQNDRRILTDRGLMVRNRDTWTVTNIRRDGAIAAAGESGAVQLPDSYVSQHVQLAYAQTCHATQGRTVERSILVLDGPTDLRGLYVPLTRGRESNDAYIATSGNEDAIDIFRGSMARSWIDQPAHARQAELADHWPGTIPPSELRALFAERGEIAEIIRRIDHELPRSDQMLQWQMTELDRAVTGLHAAERRLTRAQEKLQTLDRPFSRHWHREEIHAAKTEVERAGNSVTEAHATHAEKTALLQKVQDRIDETARRQGERPALVHRLNSTAETLNTDAFIRGRNLATDCRAEISHTVGARPADPRAANAWHQAAGRLEQFHASFGTVRGLGPESYSNPRDYADGQERAKHALNTLISEHARLNPTQHLTRDRGMRIGR